MMKPSLGVLIRFSNSAETLPDVLAAVKKQTLQPDMILGVDNGSRDQSRALIQAAGGTVVEWTGRYEHSKVLNFGLRHIATDLVLVLSSHTVLESPDTLARMVDAMSDPRTACVSGKWDADTYFSDAVDWSELQAKGLKFGSIYSNSMGMLRRKAWTTSPFDESLVTAEDYAWAIEQLQRGGICKRLHLRFGYERSGHDRTFEFARLVFQFSRRYRLSVTWLGVPRTVQQMFTALFLRRPGTPPPSLHFERLKAWAAIRLTAAASFSGR